MAKQPYHCVQCGKAMPFCTDVQFKQVPICTNYQCPNFGVLQLGIEIITEFLKDNKKDDKRK